MRRAKAKEERLVKRILRLTEQIKRVAIQREKAYGDLAATAAGECLILRVDDDVRVIKVGRPDGKWIMYQPWAFITNRKAKREELRL